MESEKIGSEQSYLLHAKRMLENLKENIEKRNDIFQNICEEMETFEALNSGVECDYKQFSETLDI